MKIITKRKVINSRNMPMNTPLYQTLAVVLALIEFEAPEWVCGVVGTILVIVWLGWIISIFNTEQLPPFGEEK